MSFIDCLARMVDMHSRAGLLESELTEMAPEGTMTCLSCSIVSTKQKTFLIDLYRKSV